MATEAIKKPEYIDFLLSPIIQEQLGFHVNVGTPDTEVERIGCLRWMLIAHSKVLRTMLLESELKVGKEMDITDLKPNTFKDFLTYIYGHDHTNGLQFGECIDLLAAAEKYDVVELKSRLAALTTAQVTTDNVCTVLEHGPVCETVPELWEKTTEIIQSKTDVVFALPQFLTLSPAAVVHILQQDALSVKEINVWRAGLNWAKAQLISDADMPSPEVLRSTMNPLLRHTRLCTVPHLDIANEVVPSNILNEKELLQIFISISANVESAELGEVCSKIKKREIKSVGIKSYFPDIFESFFGLSHGLIATTFEILVNENNVEIVSAEVSSNEAAWALPLPKGLTYQCDGKIIIEEVNYSNNASYDLVHEIPFNETVKYESDVELKMKTSSGANLVLEANNKYRIMVEFTIPHRACQHGTSKPAWDKKDFDLSNFTLLDGCPPIKYGHHFQTLRYRVID